MVSTLTQWNANADWYDQNMGEEGDELNRLIIRPSVLDAIGSLKDKIVLDVGCGSGYLTSELAKSAKEVVGTDFAPEFVKLCQKKYTNQTNLSFHVQDVTKELLFDGSSLDIVLCKMVLQYVDKIDLFARECNRVLKPNGLVVVAVNHPFHGPSFYKSTKDDSKHLGYFCREPQIKLSLWGKVELTWYPKTVSDYIQPFIKAGLRLSFIDELSEIKDGVTIPRILLLKFTKS